MGKFNILIGDITSDEILKGHDLIINPTNPYMLYGSGVCGAIFDKAGKKELEEYTTSHYKNKRNLRKVPFLVFIIFREILVYFFSYIIIFFVF